MKYNLNFNKFTKLFLESLLVDSKNPEIAKDIQDALLNNANIANKITIEPENKSSLHFNNLFSIVVKDKKNISQLITDISSTINNIRKNISCIRFDRFGRSVGTSSKYKSFQIQIDNDEDNFIMFKDFVPSTGKKYTPNDVFDPDDNSNFSINNVGARIKGNHKKILQSILKNTLDNVSNNYLNDVSATDDIEDFYHTDKTLNNISATDDLNNLSLNIDIKSVYNHISAKDDIKNFYHDELDTLIFKTLFKPPKKLTNSEFGLLKNNFTEIIGPACFAKLLETNLSGKEIEFNFPTSINEKLKDSNIYVYDNGKLEKTFIISLKSNSSGHPPAVPYTDILDILNALENSDSIKNGYSQELLDKLKNELNSDKSLKPIIDFLKELANKQSKASVIYGYLAQQFDEDCENPILKINNSSYPITKDEFDIISKIKNDHTINNKLEALDHAYENGINGLLEKIRIKRLSKDEINNDSKKSNALFTKILAKIVIEQLNDKKVLNVFNDILKIAYPNFIQISIRSTLDDFKDGNITFVAKRISSKNMFKFVDNSSITANGFDDNSGMSLAIRLSRFKD